MAEQEKDRDEKARLIRRASATHTLIMSLIRQTGRVQRSLPDAKSACKNFGKFRSNVNSILWKGNINHLKNFLRDLEQRIEGFEDVANTIRTNKDVVLKVAEDNKRAYGEFCKK